MSLIDIFRKLAGVWNFKRTIINHAQQELSGTVIGTANFDVCTDTMYDCIEKGTYTNAKQSFPIHKEFLYSYDSSRHYISVHAATEKLSTGELFRLNSPPPGSRKIVCDARHLCATADGTPDIYDAQFEFSGDDATQFSVVIKVTGPKKSYETRTVFSRGPLPGF